jgi:glycosyltransferase involved in cell wall biosynthesis
MSGMLTVAVVLTYNEEIHIARCIQALQLAVDNIVVVDSHSTDATVLIAEQMGARVLSHHWINHGIQFNWALTQLPKNTIWVLRVDADEIVTPELARSIRKDLPTVAEQIHGINVCRGIIFQGKKIRFGGWHDVKILRLFRYGYGESETRWMDEHIRVQGKVAKLAGQLIDNNLKPLNWWIDKHNQYASKEAVELLILKYKLNYKTALTPATLELVGGKRWIKENIYSHMPFGLRAFLYFIYRYFLCLGFLDGAVGFQFHFLQGFWYRYLVDLKVSEIERLSYEKKKSIPDLIKDIYQLDIHHD